MFLYTSLVSLCLLLFQDPASPVVEGVADLHQLTTNVNSVFPRTGLPLLNVPALVNNPKFTELYVALMAFVFVVVFFVTTPLRPVRALDVASLAALLGDAVSFNTVCTCFFYTVIFAGVWALAFWLAGRWPETRAFWLYTPLFGCMDTFLGYSTPGVVAVAIFFALFHLFAPKKLPSLNDRVDRALGPDFRRALEADERVIDDFRERYSPRPLVRIAAYGLFTPYLFTYLMGTGLKTFGLTTLSQVVFITLPLLGLLHVYLILLHFVAIAVCPATHTTRWFEGRQSRDDSRPKSKQAGSPRGFRSTAPARMPVGPLKKLLTQSKAAIKAKSTLSTKAGAQQLVLKGGKLAAGAGSIVVGVDAFLLGFGPEREYTLISAISGWAQKGVPQSRLAASQQLDVSIHNYSGRTDELPFSKTEEYTKWSKLEAQSRFSITGFSRKSG